MDAALLKTLGQIAGIGGIALGVVLILFREVIRKNIFPTLGPRDAYLLIRLILVLVFLLGSAGLGVWAWVQMRPPADGQVSTKFKSNFVFTHTEFNLSATPQFNYGFSSVESDKNVSGQIVRLQSLRVDLTVRTHRGFPCCDVWVLLGPGPFGFQSGGIVGGSHPFFINPPTAVAPAQVHFVVGNNGVPYTPESEATLYATYNFDTGAQGGNVDSLKAAFGNTLNLPAGLYAQIFLWNGNPNVDVDVESITLSVQGLKP
jgi:hypothetical protein